MYKIISKFDYKAIVVVAAMALFLSFFITATIAQAYVYPSNSCTSGMSSGLEGQCATTQGNGSGATEIFTLQSLLNDLSSVTNVSNNIFGSGNVTTKTTSSDLSNLTEQVTKLQTRLDDLLSQVKQQNSGTTFTSTELDSIFKSLYSDTNQTNSAGISQPASMYAFKPDEQWCEVPWTRPLGVGDQGPDVYALQKLLNSNGVTQIAQSGDGSPGLETNYFGQKTAAAMALWQEQHAQNVLTPAGLTRGSGFFGTATQGWVKQLCSTKSESFGLSDVKEVTKLSVDPIPTAIDDEYTVYVITLKNGKVHTVRDGFLPPGEIEQRFRSIGYTGDIAKLKAMAKADTKSCVIGSEVYPEGTKKTSITNSDGTVTTISDGSYVCRSGTWKVEGSLPGGDSNILFDYTIEGRTVEVTFGLANGCKGYTLSWGDGKVERGDYSNDTVCTQEYRELEFTHTYKKAANRKIQLTVRGGGQSEYEETIVEIK